MKLEQKIRKYSYLVRGVMNAYSQVFFSDNGWFAALLILATFLVPASGLAGLAGASLSILLAHWLGYDRVLISKGILSYNVVLVTLPLGLYFNPGFTLLLTVVFATLLTFFLTIAFRGWMLRFRLPFLSWPFLIGLWVVMLAVRQFSSLELSDASIFDWNRMFQFGGIGLVRGYQWLNNLPIPQVLQTYIISLGAVFFQYSLPAGLLVAVGLLIYSRIAFLLSLVGFFSAYIFYQLIGLDLNHLNYTYIGFNFILMSIAVGGFYLLPSWASFGWTLLLVPLVTFLSVSMEQLFGQFQLSVYALPFNMVVPLFLYVLQFRQRKSNALQEVVIQHNSPEKNLYAVANYRKRLGKQTPFLFSLPFLGKWIVSQGHSGKYTHQGEWRHAWDFEKTGADHKTYRDQGFKLPDYYCYGKPVFAAASGYVDSVIDGIPDNTPGDANTFQNWGNTVILRHAEALYSKYAHLQPGSVKVVAGQYVVSGQELGRVGSSGRSPEPHLHFQFQQTPYVDSKTLEYPFGHYLQYHDNGITFHSFDYPLEQETVSNLELNNLMTRSYHFIPGQRIKGVFISDQQKSRFEWEVQTDIFNNSCLFDPERDAKAWFVNDGQVFYMTHYDGKKDNPLYLFYLAQFQVPLIFESKVVIQDQIPVNVTAGKWIRWWQDWLAPFYLFLQTRFELRFTEIDDDLDPEWLNIRSKVTCQIGNDRMSEREFMTHVPDNGLFKIKIRGKGTPGELVWLER
ncbi:MAG: urea transporter [Bacteroidales bacterium]|nr:urea transporter [Bacteroidales bacterium]